MHEERQPTAAQHATPGTAPRGSNQAEFEFRSLLDAAVDAIIVIDHRGRIEQFSLSAERIFGYTAAEVIGQNVDVLMPAPYRADHDAYMHRY
ncbi:MAG: PAS domain S-box protein [Proteobacteria bacterium]|nr:PAS domain S-box protein [Pseudomonadota bacterium]